MTTHAQLSPSSAERWIHCPGSARLAAQFPYEASPAADEGTIAHDLAQFLIDCATDEKLAKDKKAQAAELNRIRSNADVFYRINPDLGGSFDEMKRYIDNYAAFVTDEYNAIKTADPATIIATEQRVTFDRYVPGGFGTSDVIIIGNDTATVIDLKFGKGVKVSAVNNPQIRLYALGAVDEYDLLYDFSTVRVIICQPRLDSITEETMTVEALRAWGEKTVLPAALKASDPDAPCVPGDWCDSHFCPAAGVCRARAAQIKQIEPWTTRDPAMLEDDEIGQILSLLPTIQSFARKCEDFAIEAIQRGCQIPGWKIVEGRSVRKYADETKVIEAVEAAGFPEELLFERSLIGLTKMQSLLGKKTFTEILDKQGLIIKPAGAPKIAPESDPRPPFNQAASDFADD